MTLKILAWATRKMKLPLTKKKTVGRICMEKKEQIYTSGHAKFEINTWTVILYRQLDETLELMREVFASDVNLGASMFNYYLKPWD